MMDDTCDLHDVRNENWWKIGSIIFHLVEHDQMNGANSIVAQVDHSDSWWRDVVPNAKQLI